MTASALPAQPGRRPRGPAVTLLASCLAIAICVLDPSLVNVALPAIGSDLRGDVADLQWVLNGYTLVVASLLMSAGALADRVGARRLSLGGAAVFGAGLLAALAAPTVELLVAAQFVIGLGGAVLLPCSIALLSDAYPERRARGRALGLWAATSAVAFAAGPIVAGVLIDAGGWRLVFALSLPLLIALVWLIATGARETPLRAVRGIDVPGQVAAIVALAALTFAITESGTIGWAAPRVLIALAVALGVGAAFWALELRSAAPMLPVWMFRSASFGVALTAGSLISFVLYGQLFLLALHLQQDVGLSATATGVLMLPWPIANAVVGVLAGRGLARFSPRVLLAAGGLVGLAGALVLSTVDASTPVPVLAIGFSCVGASAGFVIPTVTLLAVSSVPPTHVGIASSALNAGRQTGAVLGVAVLGSLVGADVAGALPTVEAVCAVAMALLLVAAPLLLRTPRPVAA